jgi:hypothetical protein
MTYVQTLLRAPGVEIPVEQLAQTARGPSLTAALAHDPDFDDLSIGNTDQEILDERAKREFKREIERL